MTDIGRRRSLASIGDGPLPLPTSHYPTVATTEEAKWRNFLRITAVLLAIESLAR
jgi:hypothetical protein